MRTRRIVLVALMGAGLLAGPARPSFACSCALGDPRTRIAQAQAAFIGTLVSVSRPTPSPDGTYNSASRVTWTFEVEETIKGSLGERIGVKSAVSGASCGLEMEVGERAGILLHRDQGAWTSGLCSTMAPGEMRHANDPHPAPDGRGPPRMVMGGQWGDVRSVLLDAAGRTLRYGRGRGSGASLVEACPGGKRSIEIAPPYVGVRALDDFRLVRETTIPATDPQSARPLRPVAAACLDTAGSVLAIFATDDGAPAPSGRFFVVREGTVVEGPAGPWRSATLQRSSAGVVAFVAGGDSGAEISRVAVVPPGSSERVATADLGGNTAYLGPLAPRPDGSALAYVVARAEGASKIVMLDLAGSEPTQVGVASISPEPGRLFWTDDGRLLAVPAETGRVTAFDSRLRRAWSAEGWRAHWQGSVYGDGALYGVGWGSLVRLATPSGSVEVLREFPTPSTYSLALVPSAVASPSPTPAPPEGPSTPVGGSSSGEAWRYAILALLAAFAVWRAVRRALARG